MFNKNKYEGYEVNHTYQKNGNKFSVQDLVIVNKKTGEYEVISIKPKREENK